MVHINGKSGHVAQDNLLAARNSVRKTTQCANEVPALDQGDPALLPPLTFRGVAQGKSKPAGGVLIRDERVYTKVVINLAYMTKRQEQKGVLQAVVPGLKDLVSKLVLTIQDKE